MGNNAPVRNPIKLAFRLLVLNLAATLLITACGSTATPTLTPVPPTLTLTPPSTALPTITPAATNVPIGSAAKPIEIVLVPPKDSTETGAALVKDISAKIGKKFTITLATSNSDLLNALCSDVPTIAWADGWTMLAALTQGCGTVAAQIGIGGAMGVQADLVVSPSGAISDVRSFKNRIFCRLNDQDTISWILPQIAMRAGGFNPAEFKNVQNYPDYKSMLQIVANNGCIAAIPAGTLNTFTLDPPFSDPTRVIVRLTTTPELPNGGLIISNATPSDIGAAVTDYFVGNTSILQGLVTADTIVPASNSDFNDMLTALQNAGINLTALGQS